MQTGCSGNSLPQACYTVSLQSLCTHPLHNSEALKREHAWGLIWLSKVWLSMAIRHLRQSGCQLTCWQPSTPGWPEAGRLQETFSSSAHWKSGASAAHEAGCLCRRDALDKFGVVNVQMHRLSQELRPLLHYYAVHPKVNAGQGPVCFRT